MGAKIQDALLGAILNILRPLVRMLLRSGVPCQALEEVIRWVFVDIASREFTIPGRKPSNSRISMLTGLSRKEVQRLKKIAAPQSTESSERYNRATRVISGWVRDHEFTDGKGSPRPLAFDGEKHSFTDLVKKYSGDIPARAVLDELLHAGAVHRREDGSIVPIARAYVPKELALEKLDILGTDAADLISTIEKNVNGAQPVPLFQRKVAYDNVPAEAARDFREFGGIRSQELLEKLDGWLAAHDRDRNPGQPGTGRKRVGIGIYYFEEDFDEEKRTEKR